VTIKKNKIDKPYYSGPLYIRFGEGFDNITSIIDLASTCNVIKKSGAFFRFESEGKTLFNVSGRENLRNFLEQNQKILQTLSSCVKLKVDEEAKAEGMTEIDEEEGLVNTMDIDNILSDVKEKLDTPQENSKETPAEPMVKKGKKSAKG
jgi:recombination protein RecA